MSEEDNIKLVQLAYDSFKTGNIETLLGTFADDIEWYTPEAEHIPFGGKRHGKVQVAGVFAALDEHETVLQFEPREIFTQGNVVIALGSYQATVKSNGNTYHTEWAHVFSISDGKIASFHEYFDSYAGYKAYQKAMTA
jgi:hypothetical protein